MLNKDQVILVNEKDEWMGIANKLDVHRSGALHRAISIFVVNAAGEMLLQKRAANKYHSPGLWTNACCSHPAPGESTLNAAARRLQEELGISATPEPLKSFLYRATVTDNLIEHELDHIFTLEWNREVSPDPDEVSELRWVAIKELEDWLDLEPSLFTSWFPILFGEWVGSVGPGWK